MSPSISSLQSSQAAWQSLANNLAESEKVLSDRAEKVSALTSRLDQLTKTWQATLDSAKRAFAPPEIVQRIQAVLTAIADATKAAETNQAQILSVQARIAAQDARISDGLAATAKAMETARTQLFEQDHPPLWSGEAVSGAGAGIVAQEKVSLHAQLPLSR